MWSLNRRNQEASYQCSNTSTMRKRNKDEMLIENIQAITDGDLYERSEGLITDSTT